MTKSDPRDTDDLPAKCCNCGDRYRVDLMISEALWNEAIKHFGFDREKTLCGRCILAALEARGAHRALHLTHCDNETGGSSPRSSTDGVPRHVWYAWCGHCSKFHTVGGIEIPLIFHYAAEWIYVIGFGGVKLHCPSCCSRIGDCLGYCHWRLYKERTGKDDEGPGGIEHCPIIGVVPAQIIFLKINEMPGQSLLFIPIPI